jgi:hypothetical protein
MGAMDEEKSNNVSEDPALAAAADEELNQACSIGWTALSKVTPWGDEFEGFAPDGSTVIFERAYVWAGEPGGDILCEVTVYRDAASFESGARASRLIPSQN